MNVFHDTKENLHISGWVAIAQTHSTENFTQNSPKNYSNKPKWDFWLPLRKLLDNIPINHPQLARFLCRLIPAQCPFERDVNLFGRTLFHIPAMCKLNPLYDELMMLRFRALSYLADQCDEDVSKFC